MYRYRLKNYRYRHKTSYWSITRLDYIVDCLNYPLFNYITTLFQEPKYRQSKCWSWRESCWAEWTVPGWYV